MCSVTMYIKIINMWGARVDCKISRRRVIYKMCTSVQWRWYTLYLKLGIQPSHSPTLLEIYISVSYENINI